MRDRKKGLAVVLVAVLAMILFGLGATLAFRSAFNISTQRRVRHNLEARYVAQAGLEHALHRIRHGQMAASEALEYAGGKALVEWRPGSGPFGEPLVDVLSRGSFLDLDVALLAKVEVDPSFLKSSSTSSEAASRPATAADPGHGGLHVTVVKYLSTQPEELAAGMNVAEASRRFLERVEKANRRYVEKLAALSRAELRWRLHQVAARVAAAASMPSNPASPRD